MTIQPGEFWVAEIRSTDQSASKKRPVLVPWLDGVDTVVAVVTTAAARSATELPLADWQAAGLRKASTVRLSHLDCLEHSLLLYRLGKLTSADAHRLRATWDLHFKPGI